MSDSTTTETTVAPLLDWSDDLNPKHVGHATKLQAEALLHLVKRDKEEQQVCVILEKAYRLYLKNDKARLTLFCGVPREQGGLGLAISTAYGYVQAGRALLTFGDELKPYQTQEPISVKALALLDRFTATPESQEEGRKAITREASSAAREQRKAMSVSGLTESVKPEAVASDGVTVTDEDRQNTRIGRIATKHQETVEIQWATFRANLLADGITLTDEQGWVAFVAALKAGATMGSASGGTTPLALDRISSTHIAVAKVTRADRLRAELELKLQQENAAALKPEPQVEKPEATIAPVAPKRNTRKATIVKDGKPVATKPNPARASKRTQASAGMLNVK